ncbi:MAG: inositol monophosphatase [Chloroflexi bacterium]|nr:MAG: inositol monophosphatase [Chloroflexota bacterium]PIE79975.1 MAG: inositol monophosphatase [Chloroflexota bacterium]
MHTITELIKPLKTLHNQIRDAVVNACETASLAEMSAIAKEGAGDTIYAIDRISEELLIEYFEREIAVHTPLVLIAEGLDEGELVLPVGTPADDALWRIIVDPIDGTRGLMYQKRSAWILTGVAPNKGATTNLQDIEFAIQTEIPLLKQHLSDQVWAQKGEGITAVRHNRLTNTDTPTHLRPSQADTIAHGFASISRFFPGVREELAAIDEEIVREALGAVQPGKAHCFEDQYICSGGQFYELMSGHDRFIADIRPAMETILAQRGLALGICCHPYDVCTELIAREMGIIVTDEQGQPLQAPLDVAADVSWVGYANQKIQQQIEPLLQRALNRRNLDYRQP